MLNNSGKSGHTCLVPDLRGNAFSFSPLRITFAVFVIYSLYYVEVRKQSHTPLQQKKKISRNKATIGDKIPMCRNLY